jgi:hypothetical protein
MTTLLLALLSVVAPPAMDTIVSVERGDVLQIENFLGDLRVRTWDRSEVNIEFEENRGGGIEVSRVGGRVEVTASGRRGRERKHEYVVSVPSWLAIEIRGRELDVRVTGLEASLEVMTREGDISVREHVGDVVARTFDGVLDVRASTGSFDLTSLDDDVILFDVEGDIHVDANDGSIELIDVDAGVVDAATVDGDIEFSGRLHRNGQYQLVTHDGNITFATGASVDAEVSVATYDGEFETEFPIVLQRLESGRELNFVLGEGGARVRLQAFDGDIRLLRSR